MVKASRYLLILATSLVLAMPAGWCCLLQHGKAAFVPTPARHDCCCEGPTSPDEEGGEPAPEPFSFCCCDNNLPLPAKAVSVDAPAGVSLLPAADLASAAQTHAAILLLPNPTPPRPLHVLQCLWL